MEAKRLLLVFYGNPDYMPMIFKEVLQLRQHFHIYLLSTERRPRAVNWPEGVEIERVRPAVEHGRIKLMAKLAKNFDYLEFIRVVRRRIKDLRPAVLYAHDARAMVATTIANRSFGIPVVYRCHDIYEDVHSWDSLQGYLERYAARAGARARMVIQYSNGRAEHFRKLADSAYPNMIVSPNYPLLNLQPDRRDLDGLIAERFRRKVIVYPGVVHRFVAIDDAVRALALLDKGWSMSMFGDADPATLERATRLALDQRVDQRVTHGGWKPPSEALIATNLGTIGIVLFKPISVNYASMATASNKLWEFAARGIPVVVPDTADYRDVLAGERWAGFFKLGDPASLADAIRQLTDSADEYREASQAAYDAVRLKYNFESVFPIALKGLNGAVPGGEVARSSGPEAISERIEELT